MSQCTTTHSASQSARQDSGSERERSEGPTDFCTNPSGHHWVFTGAAHGGDDESFHGEGRCYCSNCGADGDA